MEQFLIPAGEGASEYMEKKSRFLGLIVPVTTEAEARARLEAVKKQEYDARHNCWAYILHSGQKRYSDDGEPQGTAGQPILNVLERDGAGLNLTYEVRMGILGHTGDFIPETLEGQIVRTSDRIAYINHDIDDAMRAGILTEADIPAQIAEILGHSHSQRINTLVENMIENTMLTGTLGMQPDVAQAMDQLRTFMFARVYTNPVAKGEESKAKDMLCRLFEYYMKNPERLPPDFLPQLDFDGMERIVCDYIAGMTDRYAVYKYSELFIPATWQVR